VSDSSAQTISLPTNQVVKNEVVLGIPARLKIPKIKVDIALEQVGLTSQGAVDVPKGHSNGAWFNLGPRPGNIGSAVIVGHYGYWKNGTPTTWLYTRGCASWPTRVSACSSGECETPVGLRTNSIAVSNGTQR